MATFVLVHGAWGGSYGWRKVRRLLAQQGHEVFTPSLTGLGERAHLTGPQVDLSLHIQDVVNAIWYEDLRDITLVGYSYGGMVVTGAIDYVADRVKHLVYLDAFLPNDGEALQSLAVDLPQSFPGESWLIEPMSREYDDPADDAFAGPRRVSQPRGCFIEPVRLRTPLEKRDFSLTYIKATGDPRPEGGGGAFWIAADRTRNDPRWRYDEIATNHMVPFNKPQELAKILLEVSK
ncbi:MAG TPA: alpha/beta hydrolase [Dehalococcoidia bacterium]|jgi:pimeloyl-ACP methyl ester carboxylesterase|nr:alpha/beta hydrolase [Dehalococcoidia bacterium]